MEVTAEYVFGDSFPEYNLDDDLDDLLFDISCMNSLESKGYWIEKTEYKYLNKGIWIVLNLLSTIHRTRFICLKRAKTLNSWRIYETEPKKGRYDYAVDTRVSVS